MKKRLFMITIILLVAGISAVLAEEAMKATGSPAGKAEPGYIAFRPKDIKWMDGPSTLPPGLKMAVLEGDPKQPGLVTMRLKLPPNYTIKPHTHPHDERVTIISGTLYFGMGDKIETKKAMAMHAGSFFVAPPMTPMYAYTKAQGAVIQLNVESPWGLTFVEEEKK